MICGQVFYDLRMSNKMVARTRKQVQTPRKVLSSCNFCRRWIFIVRVKQFGTMTCSILIYVLSMPMITLLELNARNARVIPKVFRWFSGFQNLRQTFYTCQPYLTQLIGNLFIYVIIKTTVKSSCGRFTRVNIYQKTYDYVASANPAYV